jgi:2-oxoglutarate dehydrogenase E2 component (dihydrolipoamide succinyltransferase)
MNHMCLCITEHLKESQNAAASLTTFNGIDMTSLMEMWKKYKDKVLKEHDVKLGCMSAFARACTLVLKEPPAANASIKNDEIVSHDFVDLIIAVAMPKGLVTPVVRNVEDMGFVEIKKEIDCCSQNQGKHCIDCILLEFTYCVQARDSKLSLKDMAGGTFTM